MSVLLIRLDRRALPAEQPAVDVWPFRSPMDGAREPWANSGLWMLVLARLRMKDMRFSSMGRLSAMLSLRLTSLMLLRLSASVKDKVGIDCDKACTDLVGGLGKSEGLVDNTLVPLVLIVAWLLRASDIEGTRLLPPRR